MRFAMVAVLVLASACGTPSKEGVAHVGAWGVQTTANEVVLPDGSKGWTISCLGAVGACMTRARAVCANADFSIVDRRAATGLRTDQDITIRCG